MKIINQNEYNLYLEVVFSNTVLFKRAISMVALLFISNLNIIFSKDIDKNHSINYQCLWVVRDALKSEKSINELINFASEKKNK